MLPAPGLRTHLCERRDVTKATRRAYQRKNLQSLREPACWTWEVSLGDLQAAQKVTQATAYYVLLEWQRGRCAVCAGTGDLVLDHDHRTRLVRGLLCVSCNNAEARHDSPVFANYRHVPPTMILDMCVTHPQAGKMSRPATGELAAPAKFRMDSNPGKPRPKGAQLAERLCQRCEQPIPRWRAAHAAYCSWVCGDRATRDRARRASRQASG